MDVVDRFTLVTIVGIGSARGGCALLLAGRGGLRRTARRVLSRGHVVSTRRENVGLAIDGVSIEVTSNNTGVLEIGPGSTEVTTVTTLTARVTTLEEILRRDSGLVLLVGVDAESIRHGFDGTEGPA